MERVELVEILRSSLVSRRLLDVVSFGAIQIGDEFIVLKHREDCEFSVDDIMRCSLSQYCDIDANGRDISQVLYGKSVVFDHDLFNIRGQSAILEYKDNASNCLDDNMFKMTHLYEGSNNVTLEDKEYGCDEVTLKWDGCVHYRMGRNGYKPSEDTTGENSQYIHICDIDEMIKKLQDLKKYGQKHFNNDFWK